MSLPSVFSTHTQAKELETSNDAAVRNNIAVIMADLCVRYTALTEQYLPAITSRLKDASPLVRRQTLMVLTK